MRRPLKDGSHRKTERTRKGRRTDVDDVSLLVDHDVAVVAVLEAQQVGDEGVGGQALREVLLGGLELLLSTGQKVGSERT